MAKFEEVLAPNLTLRESADDGSDFTNPTADYRRLFLGEDGLLHLKDSAGTVTTPSSGLADHGVATYLDFTTGAAPSSPAAGKIRIYSLTGDHLYQKDSSGTATALDSAAGGGSYVWLQRQTASSSASLDFTSFISSTYDVYEFVFYDIFPGTDNTSFNMQVGTGGGPTYDTGSNYEWGRHRAIAASTGSTANGSATTGITLFDVQDSSFANYTLGGTIRLYNPGGAKFKRVTGNTSAIDTSGNDAGGYVWGLYGVTTALTAVRFLYSSGNIASGVIDVYGLKHA